ncbi:MAG: hypothetical protein FWE50_04810 [Alphaproteobacteria bacterium]|nr:hypothetical protein [Alphaproteobacteria bacterium]
MNFIKAHTKLVVGIAALLLVAVIFAFSMKSTNLENGELRDWASSSNDRRTAAVKILTGSDENSEIMVACINRMTTLPDASNMKVKYAASLCAVGVALREDK